MTRRPPRAIDQTFAKSRVTRYKARRVQPCETEDNRRSGHGGILEDQLFREYSFQ